MRCGRFLRRLVERWKGRAVDIAAGAAHGAQLALGIDHRALAQGRHRHPLHRHAFEDIEIHLLVMGLGRNGARRLRIPHHQVAVGAGGDHPFLRIKIEDLGRVGRGDGDEFVHRQAAGIDPVVPEHRQAILDAAGAVGNLGEIVAPGGFLVGAETAMVGRRGLQVARLQAPPQGLLMAFGAEGRAHHMGGGEVEIGVAVNAVVDGQMAGQDFTENPLPVVARPGDGVQRSPCTRHGPHRPERPAHWRSGWPGWPPRPRRRLGATGDGLPAR